MDCDLQLHVAAYHEASAYYAEAPYYEADVKRFNNDTPGLGLLCATEKPDTSVVVGTYYNSIRKQSYYAAVAYQPYRVGNIRIGGFAGVVTGYREDITPMLAAAASAPLTATIGVHVMFVPHITSVSPATTAISFSFKF